MSNNNIHSLYPDFSVRFANTLLGALIRNTEDGKNITVAPARLQAVLVLLANWASSETRKTILDTVGNGVITLKEANVLSSKNLFSVEKEDWADGEIDVPHIELQTLLWAQKELEYSQEAFESVLDDYAVRLKSVDFRNPYLKSIIDETIKTATHGLIKQLDLSITKDTVAVITDILYFKARWESVFDPDDTKEQLFYGTKEKRKVPMMKNTEYMEYCETKKCQSVKIQYSCYANEDKHFSMRIYLPKPKCTIGDILHERLNNEFYSYSENVEVKLSLPRFSIVSSFDMKRTLTDMGLSCIYESNDIIPECIKDIKIQQIVQQTKVTVNETGTEAAAVTSVGMMLGCLPFDKPKPIVMTVNHPFMFEIAEDTTETILFAGVINNVE